MVACYFLSPTKQIYIIISLVMVQCITCHPKMLSVQPVRSLLFRSTSQSEAVKWGPVSLQFISAYQPYLLLFVNWWLWWCLLASAYTDRIIPLLLRYSIQSWCGWMTVNLCLVGRFKWWMYLYYCRMYILPWALTLKPFHTPCINSASCTPNKVNCMPKFGLFRELVGG